MIINGNTITIFDVRSTPSYIINNSSIRGENSKSGIEITCSIAISLACDIDIIIIKKTKKRFFDRLDEFYNLKPQVAIDIFVYTPEEFNEMKTTNPFIKSALKKGRIIYEK